MATDWQAPLEWDQRIERHPVGSRDNWLALRRQDVTASDIAAVCGCSPYKSALKLWAEKSGAAPDENETDIMRRGRHLEDGIIAAAREHWLDMQIVKPGVYLRDPALRIGATPDAFLVDDNDSHHAVLQCKLIGRPKFDADWSDGAPIYYQLQALTEAMLAGTSTAWLAAYVIDAYRGELHLFEVPRHAAAEARIRDAVAQFWSDIEAGRMPAADYHRDGQLLALLKPPIAKAPPVDLTGDNLLPDLLDERERLMAEVKEREARIDAIKAEVLAKLDGAPAATVPGWKITYSMTNRREVVTPAKSFPTLRISRAGQKETAQ